MTSETQTEGVKSLKANGPCHAALYETDETAWLELMAGLARERRAAEIDWDHLSEFLSDMARNDRRKVLSRLERLLEHLLKWRYQPERRSRSWERTIIEQRRRLADLFESGTLRNYGEEALAKAYEGAIILASVATGLSVERFPRDCPYSLEDALTIDYGVGLSEPDA
jgi:hypothetical protein